METSARGTVRSVISHRLKWAHSSPDVSSIAQKIKEKEGMNDGGKEMRLLESMHAVFPSASDSHMKKYGFRKLTFPTWVSNKTNKSEMKLFETEDI